MTQLTCNRCRHQWQPKPQIGRDPKTYRPQECPRCKSRNWDKK